MDFINGRDYVFDVLHLSPGSSVGYSKGTLSAINLPLGSVGLAYLQNGVVMTRFATAPRIVVSLA